MQKHHDARGPLATCVQHRGRQFSFHRVSVLHWQCWANFWTCLLQGWPFAVRSLVLEELVYVIRLQPWCHPTVAEECGSLRLNRNTMFPSLIDWEQHPLWSVLALPGLRVSPSSASLTHTNAQAHTHTSPFPSHSCQSNLAGTSCYNKTEMVKQYLVTFDYCSTDTCWTSEKWDLADTVKFFICGCRIIES